MSCLDQSEELQGELESAQKKALSIEFKYNENANERASKIKELEGRVLELKKEKEQLEKENQTFKQFGNNEMVSQAFEQISMFFLSGDPKLNESQTKVMRSLFGYQMEAQLQDYIKQLEDNQSTIKDLKREKLYHMELQLK